MAKKITIPELWQLKREGKKIAATILHDYSMARIADRAGLDLMLVGDSGGRRLLGHKKNSACTMDEMILMTRSVARGAERAFVVGDLPFMSYHVSIEEAVRNAGRFITEAGADGVKLEGGADFAPTVAAIVKAGVPVLGHMGQTPMLSMGMGSREKFEGERLEAHIKAMLRDAHALEDAGAFGLVLTGLNIEAAARINKELSIFTLGSQWGSHENTQGPWIAVSNLLTERGEDEPEGRRARSPEIARAFFDAVTAQVAELRASASSPRKDRD
jgi:3-methyl-2-oxobutanoate hydroxymethyltransferase